MIWDYYKKAAAAHMKLLCILRLGHLVTVLSLLFLLSGNVSATSFVMSVNVTGQEGTRIQGVFTYDYYFDSGYGRYIYAKQLCDLSVTSASGKHDRLGLGYLVGIGETGQGIFAGTFCTLTLEESAYSSSVIPGTYPVIDGLFNNNISDRLHGFITVTTGSSMPAKSIGSNINSVFVGEPVDVATGNVFDAVTDYETYGSNKLSLKRYYNSRSTFSSTPTLAQSLGPNWKTNFERFLDLSHQQLVQAERGDGQSIAFGASNGLWQSDTDTGAKLIQNASKWTMTFPDGGIETYATVSGGQYAQLTSIKYRGGYTQFLKYNAARQLTTVSDSYARSLGFTYSGNLLSSVTTPEGLTLSYGYDTSGLHGFLPDRLAWVGYSTTPASSISYLHENASVPFAVTGVLDENGDRYASWTYDDLGRGLSSRLGAAAFLTTVSYNDANGSRTVTGPLGEIDTYKFTPLQGMPKLTEIDRSATAFSAAAVRTFTYDTNGYLASETDWNGHLTTFANDSFGRKTTIVEAAGTAVARKTTISYLGNFSLPSKIARPGLTTTFTYDSNRNTLSRTLLDTTTTTSPYPSKGQTRTWTYTWSNGLMTSVRQPRTDLAALTTFAFDASGSLITATNALGHTFRVTQHTAGGRPLGVIDANGVATTFAYDGRLRMTSATTATSSAPVVWTFGYDAAGNLSTITAPDGSQRTRTYDAAHLNTGESNLTGERRITSFDGLGNSTSDQLETISNTVTGQLFRTFDPLGRLKAITYASGGTKAFTYDASGNLVSQIDPLGHITTFSYDEWDRPVTEINSTGAVTAKSYDANGRLTQFIAPNGSKTSFVYDGFGDLTQVTSPNSGITVYRYDANGNRVQKTDARGVVENQSYDALDRPLGRTYPSDPSRNVSQAYDGTSHGFGIGKLTSFTDAAGSESLTYDELGNVIKVTRSIGTSSLVTLYSYDAASHVKTVSYPCGLKATYSRDKAGRVAKLEIALNGVFQQTTIASGIGYLPNGPLYTVTLGSGAREKRAFDASYRQTRQTVKGSSLLQDVVFRYDQADNLRAFDDLVNPASGQSFVYDPVNRLIGAKGSYGSLSFTYDPNGNLTSKGSTTGGLTFGYASASDRLQTTGSEGYGYDASGNVTSIAGSGVSRVYDAAGRFAQAKVGDQNVGTYVYDARGRRVSKATVSGTTTFQYDLDGRLLQENMPGGEWMAYLYLEDGRLFAVYSRSGGLNYIHSDRLGTPILATTALQGVSWQASYQPFAAATVQGPLNLNLRLPGQYFDAETGLHQNGMRDYAPVIGRYVESDPIGILGGGNNYAYSNNNPWKYLDLNGLCPDCPEGTQIGERLREHLDEVTRKLLETSKELHGNSEEEDVPGSKLIDGWDVVENFLPSIQKLYELRKIEAEKPPSILPLDSPERQRWFQRQMNAHIQAGITVGQDAIKSADSALRLAPY